MSSVELDPAEVFAGFDKQKRGKLEQAVAAQALRALSKNPNEKEIKEAMADFGPELSLDDFKKLAKMKFKTPAQQEKEILDAFRTLDNDGTGTILGIELRQILGGLGDALTSQEVGALMREAKENNDGAIDYHQFAEMLTYSYTGDRVS